jgi:hypothetical protein
MTWVVVETVHASGGGGSPVAAVVGATGAVDIWADEDFVGTGRYLSSHNFKAMHERLQELGQQLVERHRHAQLDLFDFQTTLTADGEATVKATVSVSLAAPNTSLRMRNIGPPWTFKTILAHGLSSGWRVDSFDAPHLCPTYFKCPGQ